MPQSAVPKPLPTAEEAFARYVLARELVHADLCPSTRPKGWIGPPPQDRATGGGHINDAGTD